MFVETYDPFQNIVFSALAAAVPILLFLVCLTLFKMKGIYAALLTLGVTFAIAMGVFGLPLAQSGGAVTEGIVQGLFPIGYIIIMAVWLYKVSVASGKFQTIQSSIASISADQRVQLLLIGFCFNAFLEGAAGFGVPIAICAVLLVQLGFQPLQAAMLCLIANGAAGAFGAIGVPVGIIDTLQLEGITAMDVSQMTALTLPLVNFSIPFLLIFLLDGLKGVKETLPAILVTAVTYTVLQAVITIIAGPELANIIPSLAAMGALAVLQRFWRPVNIFRLDGEAYVQAEPKVKKSWRTVVFAWSPFYLLTIFIMIWSFPGFKALFEDSGMLSPAVLGFILPGTYSSAAGQGIVFNLNFIGATGTAILLAVLVTVLFAKNMNWSMAQQELMQTVKELWLPIVTICAILAVAKLATYGGLTMAMGEAAAMTGNIFPFLSPVLGWIGVFMTGSVVNNNTLFASIQTTAASGVGVDGALLVAANTAGGVMAKLISPQSIAIATAAVGQTGKEGQLMKMTLKYSLYLLLFVCLWTFGLSVFIH
ncbi:L-lactate permease [Marinococcus halotolerans]|uniref:L-lactate permease n=1 Tax=Marinococcus halotolerans TaxID=301092 RepID=UPI0003B4667E|nr:L-lactate permease [Marinococcus halotolerans]